MTLFSLPFLCLFFADQVVINIVARNENSHWRDFASRYTDIASAWIWLPATIVLGLASFIVFRVSRDQSRKKFFGNIYYWALHFLLALLSTGLVAQIFKICAGRERPCFPGAELRVWSFGLFRNGYLYSSFPSGHSQVIFCAASFIALLIPKLRLPAFFFAMAVAATRVLVLKHFPSDVAAGMLIGVYGSWLSVQFWSARIPIPIQLFSTNHPSTISLNAKEEDPAA